MSAGQDFVSVFRSPDSSAGEEAAAVRDLLAEAGLEPVILTDSEPDVMPGCTEVRVPASQEAQAEKILSAARNAEPPPGDTSHSLDLVTLYDGVGTNAEIEALSIRAVLDAAGIRSVMAGTSELPNLPVLVKVPRMDLDQARAALEEARKAGPAAADEAEQATETGKPGEP